MKNILKITLLICLVAGIQAFRNNIVTEKFEANYPSLEQVNPVPEWFKDAKFGIYFHWGVYSVPAYANEWYPRSMFIEGSNENLHHIETYGKLESWPYDKFITGEKDKAGNWVQFAPILKSEGGNFDPEEWAQLFADAGARYAGPVAEHHDGFSMWASRVNPWNAMDMGPKLDLVGILTEAIRKHDMKIILSMHHAYNITGFYEAVPPTDDPKLKILYGQQGKEKNEELWLNKHKEIIDAYRPDIIWQDFNLPVISEPVLLEFLAYYYNSAIDWNKEVVATYKDALNVKCAVLDYERGGPTDLTDNYWLTDDAISSSSWCYTEGIGYYTAKQVFHGFIDRVSKNGNLLLNISPKSDGTIPVEQKEVLLAMGDWLKKYGEAVYATRAWEKYGEGPTKMGAAHGVFTAPTAGNAKDVRYTRSKDNSILYAILLGWDEGQKEVILSSLSTDRIDLSSLKTVSLISKTTGNYLPLKYRQDANGLIISLPEKSFDEMAYVVKLDFNGTIPSLDKYIDLDCAVHYYLVPGGDTRGLVLGSTLALATDRKNPNSQWKLEHTGHGVYKIVSLGNLQQTFECSANEDEGFILQTAGFSGKENQLWKMEQTFNGLVKITNKQYSNLQLTVPGDIESGAKATVSDNTDKPIYGWKLKEICELRQEPYKKLTIPGTIEVEDFDSGCLGDAYYDKDETNAGGEYRLDVGVDIEVCAAGGFNTGWASSGEWMAYTLHVAKSGNYSLSIFVATVSDKSRMHIEFNGEDITGSIPVPNTGGYQSWQAITKNVSLKQGPQTMKIVLDEASAGLNLDKLVFTAD